MHTKRERSLQSRVKTLVSSECANHANELNGIRNHCWAREKSNAGQCIFFTEGIENPRCQYFEQAVLPLDKELKAIFSSELLNLEIQEGRKRLIRKKCERCPEIFLAKSNAQRFCPACQKWNENEKTRARMANLRKKTSGVSLVTV